jgi:hypothetical protein
MKGTSLQKENQKQPAASQIQPERKEEGCHVPQLGLVGTRKNNDAIRSCVPESYDMII